MTKASLTSRRTCFYVLSTGKNWPNRKAHVRYSYPTDHTQRPEEEFWHVHNFLRAPFVARDLYEERALPLRSPCACRKFKMRGERRKMASKQVQDTYLCLAFHLRSPCQVRVKWVQLTWHVHIKCLCRLACKRDSRGKNALYSTWYQYLSFKVSCGNFGGSLTVHLEKII
jgi:hypothetical protein